MSHPDVIDFCSFFAGGYLAVALLLHLASAVSDRAAPAAAYTRRQWPPALLACCGAAGVFFFGSHWDWTGVLLAADGRHFADGCPLDLWLTARLWAVGRSSLAGVAALFFCVAVAAGRIGLTRKH